MSSPYVGEIRMFAGNFAPVGWALCQGQLMPISENEVLFNLIGTTYGGDGQETFALPDLRGRIPIHQGTGFTIGQLSGVETVTLTTQQIPAHNHPALGNDSSGSSATSPANALWLNWDKTQYSDQPLSTPMNPGAMQPSGGSQPHENMMPFLTVNFIISLFGIFPSQT